MVLNCFKNHFEGSDLLCLKAIVWKSKIYSFEGHQGWQVKLNNSQTQLEKEKKAFWMGYLFTFPCKSTLYVYVTENEQRLYFWLSYDDISKAPSLFISVHLNISSLRFFFFLISFLELQACEHEIPVWVVAVGIRFHDCFYLKSLRYRAF